jgi:hypothetical protein
MSIRYDDKGKYFTDVVRKQAVEAVIQTDRERIYGTIYIQPDERVLDELNQSPRFLPVTDARVVSEENQATHEFLAVNIDHIVWLSTLEGD